MEPLTDQERRILAFEKRTWRHRGAKDESILRELGLSSWRYQQALMAVCERPAALALEPVLVNRVNRLRKRA